MNRTSRNCALRRLDEEALSSRHHNVSIVVLNIIIRLLIRKYAQVTFFNGYYVKECTRETSGASQSTLVAVSALAAGSVGPLTGTCSPEIPISWDSARIASPMTVEAIYPAIIQCKVRSGLVSTYIRCASRMRYPNLSSIRLVFPHVVRLPYKSCSRPHSLRHRRRAGGCPGFVCAISVTGRGR